VKEKPRLCKSYKNSKICDFKEPLAQKVKKNLWQVNGDLGENAAQVPEV